MNIFDTLKIYLLSEIAVDAGIKTLEPDDDLLEQGIIDSMGIMKLVTFMEETFGIGIDDEDIVPENFQTLTSMTEYIEQKLRAK
jgi:acyl carrier protein